MWWGTTVESLKSNLIFPLRTRFWSVLVLLGFNRLIFNFLLGNLFFLIIFAVQTARSPVVGLWAGLWTFYLESVYLTLFLDYQKSGKFQSRSRMRQR